MVRRIAAIVLFVVAVGGVGPASAGTVAEPLKTGPVDQFGPAAEGDAGTAWLGWSQFTNPFYTAMVQQEPYGTVTNLRRRPGHTFFGDFDPSSGDVIFQDNGGRANANVYLVDPANPGDTSAPPAGINTEYWEWAPEMSANFILFGRNRFNRGSSPWKVILYNRTTQEFVTLDQVENRCGCIWPEDVNERYAAWTTCTVRCNVWVYDTQDLKPVPIKVPNPGFPQYAAAVSEEGRVYYVRSGNTCGGNTQIRSWDVELGGATSLEYDYPTGTNLASALDVVDIGGAHDIYFDRADCGDRNFRGNIYRLVDAFFESGPIFRGPVGTNGGDAQGAWRGPQRPGARPIG